MDFVSSTFLKTELLVAYEGLLVIDGFAVNMAQNAFAPQLGTTLADITYANFVGYFPRVALGQAFTLFRDTEGGSYVLKPNFEFSNEEVEVAGAITGPQTIFGWLYQGGASGTLFCTALLPSPKEILAQGDGVQFPQTFLTFSDSFLV